MKTTLLLLSLLALSCSNSSKKGSSDAENPKTPEIPGQNPENETTPVGEPSKDGAESDDATGTVGGEGSGDGAPTEPTSEFTCFEVTGKDLVRDPEYMTFLDDLIFGEGEVKTKADAEEAWMKTNCNGPRPAPKDVPAEISSQSDVLGWWYGPEETIRKSAIESVCRSTVVSIYQNNFVYKVEETSKACGQTGGTKETSYMFFPKVEMTKTGGSWVKFSGKATGCGEKLDPCAEHFEIALKYFSPNELYFTDMSLTQDSLDFQTRIKIFKRK